MLIGANFVASSWLAWPWSLLAALAAAGLLAAMPIVLTHDVAVAIGIAGLSAMLGMSLTPLIVCGALALLSVYDIVSVYRTRHMVSLANNMISSGAIFGFLVPARLSGFFLSRRKALDSRQVMMLGSGDIGLPLLLVTSTVSQSLPTSILVAAFTLVGLSVMHWLFSHQKERLPMAALPPIAMFAILGYVTAVLLGI
jgi:presenilin-like A22 family membrane protease